MESMGNLLKMNLKNLGSESIDYKLKFCEKCGQPIETKIELLGNMRVVPVICECRKKELEKMQEEIDKKEKQARLNQLLNNSLMDSKFKNYRFDNWDHEIGNKRIFEITKRYSNNFSEIKEKGIGLIIYGLPGNGKTFASGCIANDLIDRFIPVACISINSLLGRIKQGFNSSETEANIINGLNNADLLILDDLGTELDNEWTKTVIYNIIDSRYRNGLPLVVTTNISFDDIKNKYHQRTYDRLIEMCTPLKNENSSIRTKKGIEKTNVLNKLLK